MVGGCSGVGEREKRPRHGDKGIMHKQQIPYTLPTVLIGLCNANAL